MYSELLSLYYTEYVHTPSIGTYYTLLHMVSVLITILPHIHTSHTLLYIYIHCTEQYIHTALSTLLFPLLDRLLGHNPGSVEGGVKTDVLADGKPGAWLLQYPPQRDWNAVTDELDCLDLDLRWIVGGVQFDTILIAEISASSIQVLAKIRFSMRADMVSPVLPLPRPFLVPISSRTSTTSPTLNGSLVVPPACSSS